MTLKVWIAIGAEALVFAMLLFGAAGTMRWFAAWAFLALFFAAALVIAQMLAREDPALLEERMSLPFRKGQPVWDRVVISGYLVLFPAWFVLMSLDAVRFGWSVMPAWLQRVGAAGVIVAMRICYRVFQENTFLAPTVRIQRERGQKVVSSGPYAVVRHPLYAGVLILFPSIALMLGSWWGLAASLALLGGLVVRTALEDRELQRSLGGYPDYARRVRYRLIPLIW